MWYEVLPNWLTAIAAGITCYAIVVAYKQYVSDHERSRRENAANLVLEWSRVLLPRASVSKKFAETLSPENSKSLFNTEPFNVPATSKKIVAACLAGVVDEKEFRIEGETLYLGIREVAEIRWQVISYLNLLEAVLVAWRHNTADREILEEEFSPLVKDVYEKPLLGLFREATGGLSGWPAVEEFVNYVLPKTKPPKPGKPSIAV